MIPLPNEIEVTFTKEDVETADRYSSNTDCLMATALKRMGYNHSTPLFVSACGITSIAGVRYYPREDWGCADVMDFGRMSRRPYYNKSVIGSKVTLVKERQI